MKYKIYVSDQEDNSASENVIEVRKNTSLKTVVLKGVEKHVEQYASDPTDFMREVKYLFRESEEQEEFKDDLKSDLDLLIEIGDMNNHRYYHEEKDEYTTAYEVGLDSYKRAWEEQLNSEDGQRDFDKYLPEKDDVIEHGNRIMADYLDEYDIED